MQWMAGRQRLYQVEQSRLLGSYLMAYLLLLRRPSIGRSSTLQPLQLLQQVQRLSITSPTETYISWLNLSLWSTLLRPRPCHHGASSYHYVSSPWLPYFQSDFRLGPSFSSSLSSSSSCPCRSSCFSFLRRRVLSCCVSCYYDERPTPLQCPILPHPLRLAFYHR